MVATTPGLTLLDALDGQKQPFKNLAVQDANGNKATAVGLLDKQGKLASPSSEDTLSKLVSLVSDGNGDAPWNLSSASPSVLSVLKAIALSSSQAQTPVTVPDNTVSTDLSNPDRGLNPLI